MYNKWCWESWAVTCNRVKLDPYLTPYTKINSKWITNLQVRLETVKFLEENINGKFHDMSLGKNKQVELPQTKKLLLQSKGNHQQNQKGNQRGKDSWVWD